MTFLLSSTFTDSLARLSSDEQKLAKTTAFDLQVNPANPGHQFHKLDAVRDKDFWSVRASSDLRIIVHKTAESLMLCYVDHHDKAYAWAERRKLETHPSTGASQIVEIRETVKEVIVPHYVDEPVAKKKADLLFARYSDTDILSWGVPTDWLDDVRNATDESILELAEHLPDEAAEALLEIATGGSPRVQVKPVEIENPYDHPDSQRRFRVLNTPAELQQAFDYPWDKWITFLHPDQRELVERDFSGPVRVSGSAGTGKTIVALHRSVWLAKHDENARVLLVTFSDILASALKQRLRRLIASTPSLSEQIEVHSMDSLGERLFKQYRIEKKLADDERITGYLVHAIKDSGGSALSFGFIKNEWTEVVDDWDVRDWETYRDIPRIGRKTRLPESARKTLWVIFSKVREKMEASGEVTNSGMYMELIGKVRALKHPLFEYVIVDEAQDISVPQLKFIASFGVDVPNRIMLCGDTGQRIFRQGFSWKAHGIEVRGRSVTLHVNYRTSHQIRQCADRLLDPDLHDIDGNEESRKSTVSVFNGMNPMVVVYETQDSEKKAVLEWIINRIDEGLLPHEICLCVRSVGEIGRAHEVAVDSGLSFKVLDDHVETIQGKLALCTMHHAKGLEFRAVAVMACDDGVIPSQDRIDSVTDTADLEEVYNTERQLLYVACTRARDYLLVTSGGEPSEFLRDLSHL